MHKIIIEKIVHSRVNVVATEFRSKIDISMGSAEIITNNKQLAA